MSSRTSSTNTRPYSKLLSWTLPTNTEAVMIPVEVFEELTTERTRLERWRQRVPCLRFAGIAAGPHFLERFEVGRCQRLSRTQLLQCQIVTLAAR